MTESASMMARASDRDCIPNEIIGSHPSVTALTRQIDQVARLSMTVLVLGQTGVGKELVVKDSIANEYAGVGDVLSTYRTNPWNTQSTWYRREMFESDALGNQYLHRIDEDGSIRNRDFSYQASTGRLTRTTEPGSWDADTSTYDAAGNLRTLDRYVRKQTFSQQSFLTQEVTVNFYDAEGRLRTVDRRTSVDWSSNFWPRDKGGFEEYRYDALGRRILTRVRRDSTGVLDGYTPGSAGTIERYVWDQDQLLYEIRYPGGDQTPLDSLERDTSIVRDSICTYICAGDPEASSYMIRYYPHYGRVMYTHGPGVDEPLSILRAGYGKDSVRFHPFHVLPHRDGLGRYDIGTFTLGTATYQQDGAWVEIEWPARNTQTFHRFKPETPEPVSWMGGLIDQQRTIGGNLYMRNRYYDPVSGRFTQEDPIGLAGGLNIYGFANGDPVNFSDPFGLCPVCIVVALRAAPYIVTGAKLVIEMIDPNPNDAGSALGRGITQLAKRAPGSYEVLFQSGKRYFGKGGTDRALSSARRVATKNDDKVTEVRWRQSHGQGDADAFKDEARRLESGGGVESKLNYNEINSPGKRLLEQERKEASAQTP